MDVWGALRTIGRRWYVSLVVLLLCAAATSSVVARAEAKYTAEATVMLLPPTVRQASAEDTELVVATNPFLESGIPATAAALTSASNSDRVADLLRAANLHDVEFQVANGTDAPVIFIQASSNSAAQTSAALPIIVTAVQDITRELQVEAQSPPSQLISAQVLAPPPGAPAESLAAKTKIAMGMAIGSFLVVVCSALVADNIANRRRRRRMVLAARHELDRHDAATAAGTDTLHPERASAVAGGDGIGRASEESAVPSRR